MTSNPKYTNGMPGRDWDILNTQLTSSIIPEIEKDTVAMVRYLADDFSKYDECWLCKAGGMAAFLGEETGNLAERFTTKLKNSGSWILGITGALVKAIRLEVLKITLRAVGGDVTKYNKTFAQVLTEAELRIAETSLENEFIDVLIEALPKFYEMSPAGLEKFKSAPKHEKKPVPLPPQRGQAPQPRAAQQSQPTQQTQTTGHSSKEVIDALDVGLKNLVPAEVQAIRGGRAQSIYPPEARNTYIGTAKFSKAKSAYEARKRKEKTEYENAENHITRLRTENALKKENRRKKTRKTILIFTIIAAIAAVLFFLLKGAATIPQEVAYVISIVAAFVIAVIIGIVWQSNNASGGCIAWFISYVAIAVLLILLFMGARALFNGEPFGWPDVGGDGENSNVLQSVTLNVDKTSATVNDKITLSFTPNPAEPEKALIGENNEADYDALCIEYYVSVDGEEVQIGSRKATIEYTFKQPGEYVFWAEYCQHDGCDGTYDVVSNRVTVSVGGNTISSAEDLNALRGSGEVFELTKDIDLSGVEWTPIEGFTGTLIGNGYAIKNLTIDTMDSNIGLFAQMKGSVENLVIKNAQITASGRTECVGILCGVLQGSVKSISIVAGSINAENSNYVGAVAGKVSSLSEKTVTNLISSAEVVGRDYVGGIFGTVSPSCDGEGDSATFSNIINLGAVTGENYVGGVFGNMYFNGSHAIVHYSYPAYMLTIGNEGNVTGKTYVGGIVGSGDTDTTASYIIDSYNKAVITAEAVAGCIAGYCDLTIENCANEGSQLIVTGFLNKDGEKLAYVGGFVGKGAVIRECTNNVDIAYSGGGKYVAGIMGYSSGYPKNVVMDSLHNKGDISGADYVGGIFGRVSPESNGEGDSIAFNKMQNDGTITGINHVGGILGYLYLNGSHAIVHYDFPGYFTLMENRGEVVGE